MTEHKYRLSIEYDHNCEEPENQLGRMVSFNTRHINYQDPDTIDPGEILATLSYYEHGRHRWMIGSSTVPDPGQWDTVQLAGVVVWNGDDDERSWWHNELSDDDRNRILVAIADEYTAWGNGDTFGYNLERLEACEYGHIHATSILESLWGFIGIDGLLDNVRSDLAHFEIDPDTVEIAGEASGYVDVSDLSRSEVAA